MSDNDQAAVEALLKIRCPPPSKAYTHGDLAVPYREGAEAILDAIRAGKVPGVWCGALADEIASAQLVRELRAEVERLREESARKTCDLIDQTKLTVAEKARADKAESDLDYVRTCKTMEMVNRKGGRIVVGFSDNLCVESFAMKWITENNMEVRDFTLDDVWNVTDVVDQRDKATAERDRLAGLLDEAWPYLAENLQGRISAALAEVGKP